MQTPNRNAPTEQQVQTLLAGGHNANHCLNMLPHIQANVGHFYIYFSGIS